jgi:hypothetical protein
VGYPEGGYGGDLLVYGPSSQNSVKISPAKLSRKRALLYDRTLFRKDYPKKTNFRQRD